jgi:serine/threonine-protein kinase
VYGGRYRIDAVLGRGGMGVVLRAHDLEARRDLALKVLHPDIACDDQSVARFRREAEILARIEHPGVPRCFGLVAEGGELFFVTEFIDGRDLKSELGERGPMAIPAALELAATVADALAAAHELGVVHRDVKPQNIMLGKDGRVCLVDFGVARLGGEGMDKLTATGSILGTPAYMSPEHFDSHRVDARSDLYSLGVVLFEALCGRLPFQAQSPLAMALAHRDSEAPGLRTLRPEVPPWLDRVVLRLLSKKPAARYSSAVVLARDLREGAAVAAPRRRRLLSGDLVVEDPASEWALVLAVKVARREWEPGMALRFEDRYFKLAQVDQGTAGESAWTYRFGAWPDAEVMRKVCDYEADTAERTAKKATLGDRLRRLFSR